VPSGEVFALGYVRRPFSESNAPLSVQAGGVGFTVELVKPAEGS
jgi:hypothetical protein